MFPAKDWIWLGFPFAFSATSLAWELDLWTHSCELQPGLSMLPGMKWPSAMARLLMTYLPLMFKMCLAFTYQKLGVNLGQT